MIPTELLFLADLLLVLMTHGVEDFSGANLQGTEQITKCGLYMPTELWDGCKEGREMGK